MKKMGYLRAALAGVGVTVVGLVVVDAAYNGVPSTVDDMRNLDSADAVMFGVLGAIGAATAAVGAAVA